VLLLLQLVIAEAGRLRPLGRSRVGIVGAASIILIAGCGGSQLYQHIEAGNAAYEELRYEDALTAYREARLVAPDEPVVGYNLGNTLHQLRRFEEAAVLTTEALNATVEPTLVQSLRYALGAHAVERGLLFEARTHYIDVLRIDPLDQDAKANLELVLNLIGSAEPPPPEEPAPVDQPPAPEDPQGTGEPARTGDGGVDGQPQITDDPDDGDSQDGDSPDDQGPGTPGGDDPPSGQSGQPADPTDGEGAGAEESATNLELAIAEAEAALAQALIDAGEEITVEDALLLLELSSELSALRSLESRGAPAGSVTDR